MDGVSPGSTIMWPLGHLSCQPVLVFFSWSEAVLVLSVETLTTTSSILLCSIFIFIVKIGIQGTFDTSKTSAHGWGPQGPMAADKDNEETWGRF